MIGLLLALGVAARAAEADLPVGAWCDHADLVAVAEVTSSETFWTDAPRGGIATRYWLSVASVWKGPKADTLEVVLPGGSLDGLTLWVSDLPDLGLDRTYVVLLARDGAAWAPAVGSRSAVAVAVHPRERLVSIDAVRKALGPCD